MIGIKIYAVDKDLVEYSLEWQSLGINTVFLGEPLISDGSFRDFEDKTNLTTFLIIPIFYNTMALKNDPDLYAITGLGQKAQQDWVSFICPSRQGYQQARIEYITSLIQRVNPDGISLDFIRHFIYWERISPHSTVSSLSSSCFDTACLNEFQYSANVKIPTSRVDVTQKAQWIIENCYQEWSEWKCRTITALVREITQAARRIKPDILINIHALPWRNIDFDGAIRTVVGQDFKKISNYVNYISPMCYSHMQGRPPDWINSVVRDIHQQSGSQVVPSIQVKEHYKDEPFTMLEFEKCISQALRPPSQGVVFWSWEALEKDPQRKDIIKQRIMTR